MSRPKVNLKNPVYAAILAFLLPGMGHFYQRRIFKGVLYSVCILGTFFTGLSIGHGKVVVYPRHPDKPNATHNWVAKVKGTLATAEGNEPIAGVIEGGALEPEVAPWSGRLIKGRFVGQVKNQPEEVYELEGTIPRTL